MIVTISAEFHIPTPRAVNQRLCRRRILVNGSSKGPVLEGTRKSTPLPTELPNIRTEPASAPVPAPGSTDARPNPNAAAPQPPPESPWHIPSLPSPQVVAFPEHLPHSLCPPCSGCALDEFPGVIHALPTRTQPTPGGAIRKDRTPVDDRDRVGQRFDLS
jgi:hypothetical protein